MIVADQYSIIKKCVNEMILSAQWRLKSGKLFEASSSYKFSSSYTDYGFCCKIFPQLDFENNATKNIDVSEYKSIHFFNSLKVF